jgi:hypothetical protein
MAGQGNVAVNPLIEKFGPGPLSIFAVIRMPTDAVRLRDASAYDAMVAAAKSLASDYKVRLGRCECCGSTRLNDHVVGEANAGPAATRRRWVVCRPCIQAHGGRTLRTKLAYMDHTRSGGKQ